MIHLTWPTLILLLTLVGITSMGIGGVLVYVLEEIHFGHEREKEDR